MHPNIKLTEVGIVVLAENHNPTILNPDFLYRNGIVPEDWEQARNPICTDPLAQVAFKSGVTIIAELNKLIFIDREISTSELSPIKEIARKFIQTLPHVKYNALGINPKALMLFSDQQSLRDMMFTNFVRTGPWTELEGFDAGANLTLFFEGKEKKATFNLEEVIGSGEEKGKHGLQIRGNIHYDLPPREGERANEQLQKLLDGYEKDLEFFTDFAINKLFKDL